MGTSCCGWGLLRGPNQALRCSNMARCSPTDLELGKLSGQTVITEATRAGWRLLLARQLARQAPSEIAHSRGEERSDQLWWAGTMMTVRTWLRHAKHEKD